MDFEDLKKSVNKIEMPDEMRVRIIRNCQSKTLCKTYSWLKNPLTVAVAASFCLCFTVAAAAAGHAGFFKDITNWKGAITGTEYMQASEEIEVSAVFDENGITVFAVMADPDTVPYREMETLGIGHYQIFDMSGNVIVEGGRTEMSEVADGEAEVKIPLDSSIPNGDYKLVINAFVSGKKADQPLQIHGAWECGFKMAKE